MIENIVFKWNYSLAIEKWKDVLEFTSCVISVLLAISTGWSFCDSSKKIIYNPNHGIFDGIPMNLVKVHNNHWRHSM